MTRRVQLEPDGSTPRSSPDFALDAVNVLERLQVSVAEVVRNLPQIVKRGADLGKALNIERVMAWKIYSLVTAASPLAAGPFVLKPKAMARFLQACRDHGGVSPSRIARVDEAFQEFQQLVARHASDRGAFDSMVRDLAGEDDGKDDLKHKREAFRAARHFCGVHADLHLGTWLIMSPIDGRTHTAFMRGYSRMQQGRSDTNLLTTHLTYNLSDSPADTGESTEPMARRPLGSFHLLKEFCSTPLPEFRVTRDKPSLLKTAVYSSGMGSEKAVTYFFAGSGVAPTPQGEPYLNLFVANKVPCQVFVANMWIHKDSPLGGLPIVRMYLNPSYFIPNDGPEESDQLLLRESITLMPPGLHSSFIPELPLYPEMVAHLAELAGWSIHDFRLWRCRIEYPVLGSTLVISIPRTQASNNPTPQDA